MAIELWHGIPILDDSTPDRDCDPPPGCQKGLELPDDHKRLMVETFGEPPAEMGLIPEGEWSDRIKEQDEQRSSLFHIWSKADDGRMPPNLDQNGSPLCWAHSTTNADMMARAVSNLPYVGLSAYALAWQALGGGRQSGAWCGLSCRVASEFGIPSQELWAQGRWDGRLDTPELAEDAKRHQIDERWFNLSSPDYGQRMSFAQVATALLNNQPCAVDFNWWRHSVCGVRVIEIERGSYGLLILNSWGSGWGDNGFGILRGSKAIPDGAISIRSTTASGV